MPVEPISACLEGCCAVVIDALRSRVSSKGSCCRGAASLGCCADCGTSCRGGCCQGGCWPRRRSRCSRSRKIQSDLIEGYGENLFKGAVAEPYLRANGLSPTDLESGAWVHVDWKADAMALAVAQWGVDRGAKNFCHVFQPLAATYRHGQVGMVQNAIFEFGRDGRPEWKLKGKDLLHGETDGSSYPNGGLRATHSAGGYLTVDPESPFYLRGDCIFAPACLVSFDGKPLDEKTPLLRATQALSRSGKCLFSKLGVKIDGMVINIGLEQEFFFVPRDKYRKRPDLQMTGRTVMGRLPARGQELCDHYMAPVNTEGAAMRCMQEIQEECYKMGIPLRTRHREVAPNQYEFAPLFGKVGEHTDENLRIMQVMEEVSAKHGLACLLAEKPFQGVNGSGKHNNWSISAVKNGVQTNLYNPSDLMKFTGRPEVFPIIMAATVAAVDKFGDLMRAAIACPGNDFRLGAMEAPPAVLSTYLGQQTTDYLVAFMQGDIKEFNPRTKQIDLGVDTLPKITAPAEDRNRTSPFPFGGHRFEFRACGSSQNVSFVNTVLAAMIANEFREIGEKVDQGYSAVTVAQQLLKQHMKCVYNGNGYDPTWPDRAVKQGVCRIDSGVDALSRLTDPKNVDLFVRAGIFTADEVKARRGVLLELYVGTVEMEAQVMVDMINQHCLPSVKKAGLVAHVEKLSAGAARIAEDLERLDDFQDEVSKAKAARALRLGLMVDVRKDCDAAEGVCPSELWTLATYQELFFLDQNEGAGEESIPTEESVHSVRRSMSVSACSA